MSSDIISYRFCLIHLCMRCALLKYLSLQWIHHAWLIPLKYSFKFQFRIEFKKLVTHFLFSTNKILCVIHWYLATRKSFTIPFLLHENFVKQAEIFTVHHLGICIILLIVSNMNATNSKHFYCLWCNLLVVFNIIAEHIQRHIYMNRNILAFL